MRGKSHQLLGKYLTRHFPENTPRCHVRAFLFGCIQPDRNPATYLKGSVRSRWFRGHNYENAKRYMKRISTRLENKHHWNILDWYTLGKLIHYTADAFTYAHNECFGTDLHLHQVYEAALQDHFLAYLGSNPDITAETLPSVCDVIHHYHGLYRRSRRGFETDSLFALTASCCVLATLFSLRKP